MKEIQIYEKLKNNYLKIQIYKKQDRETKMSL
jgi:hypothetical protein